ncbi:MAG: heat-inducible transcription repressor HrcA [Clostridiales bacterium]|jgi:heat-inducible transcriptional repressor|nr:heat-inducible transcription repressor HrcA [Clostridiales bacterium]OPZ69619.1 MAG: Heat-inducible transcription repressor HrcA [Firmicutes bacterium ADurb.Bin467]
MGLDERKFLILQAIIDDYITTAMPVGSRTISRKAGVGFSPATIRNEMSDLEELGYLAQPHTSAGRIPSYKAYRLYVDKLLKAYQLSNDECQRIAEHMETRSRQVEAVIRRAARVLSDATKYTSVVVVPHIGSLRIRHVQIVPVSEGVAMLVIVTTAGIVKDAVIHIPEGLTADHLYGISRMLTEQLADKPIESVRQIFAEMIRDMGQNRKLLADAMRVIEENIASVDDRDVYVGGSANLLSYPEYADVAKAKNFLAVLESREMLRKLMGSGGVEISIRIGPENELPELSDCSIVTASYRMGDQSTGTLGIIGPTRMDYSRVITVLHFMGNAISQLLSEK